jgi:hypothetical protein
MSPHFAIAANGGNEPKLQNAAYYPNACDPWLALRWPGNCFVFLLLPVAILDNAELHGRF